MAAINLEGIDLMTTRLSDGVGICSKEIYSAGNTNCITSSFDSVITGDVMAIFSGFMITGAVIAIDWLFKFSGVPNTPMYLANVWKEELISLLPLPSLVSVADFTSAMKYG